MRFEKGHKEQTRRRIIETASRKFRKDGVAAVGIAGLMAEAGLTHGGFYAHFASKEDLVRAALDEALASAPSGLPSLEAIVRLYLHPGHRDAPEQGCAAAALISEIARHGPETRSVLTVHLRERLRQIGDAMSPAMDEAERETFSIALFGMMLGCLQMARAVNDPALSDRILESGVQAALALAAGRR